MNEGRDSLLIPAGWDSELFGLKIARLAAAGPAEDRLAKGREEAVRQRIQCLFAELAADEVALPSVPEATGYRLVDLATWLRAPLPGDASPDQPRVEVLEGTLADVASIGDSLSSLASWSKFASDPRFGVSAARRVCKSWVERSAASPDELFLIARIDGETAGFITCEATPRSRICLIASTVPNAGVGRLLVSRAMDWAGALGDELWVKTSLRNVGALRFYEACGFRIREILYAYHLWIDELS